MRRDFAYPQGLPGEVRKPRDGDGGAKNFSENDVKGQAMKKVEVDASAPTTGGGEGSPVRGLIQEAAGLLKSLRGPELRRIQVSSLEVKNKRALLDGGATHSLRQCVSAQSGRRLRRSRCIWRRVRSLCGSSRGRSALSCASSSE